jgi:hypothetical protein
VNSPNCWARTRFHLHPSRRTCLKRSASHSGCKGTELAHLSAARAKREDIRVSLDNKVLMVRGEPRFEAETKRDNYQRLKHSYGEFSFI